MARIVSIVYQPEDRKYKDGHFGHFIRGKPIGVLARVLTSGIIEVDDLVQVLEHSVKSNESI